MSGLKELFAKADKDPLSIKRPVKWKQEPLFPEAEILSSYIKKDGKK